jgi:4-amino-4-deoxy-L-arabinose transferase-like glycosyltransferase
VVVALLSIWVLHGAIAFWQFISIPAEAQGSPFEVSPQRLLVSGILLLWTGLNLAFIIRLLRNSTPLTQWLSFLERPRVHDGILISAALMMLLRVIIAVASGLFSPELIDRFGGYIDRLLPALDLMTYVSLEAMLVLVFRRSNKQQVREILGGRFVRSMVVVLALLGLTGAIIASTGLGITAAYRGDWGFGVPAVPLLEWQILLASLLCLGMVFIEIHPKFPFIPHLDFWIAVLIWLVTVVTWLSQPVVPHPSALEPRAPNFEIYPFIDAQTYDTYSQSVLVGGGFGGVQIPQRPLYVVFLTMLHLLAGQDYVNMVAAQTLFLALFPVLLYLFGKEFFGRPIGLSIALLAVLRDVTSNLVAPFTGNLSYSKVFLSEIPTAMFLVLSLWIGMRWIRAGFPLFLGFLMGGILGAAMLVRTQAFVALPVILLFAILMQPRKIRLVLRSALILSVSLVLAISPWLWRNWRITGQLIFDHPASQVVNLAARYSRINGVAADTQMRAGESIAEYQARLGQIAAAAISSNPRGALLGVSNYFLNHGINNILLLPLRNHLQDLGELWIPTDAFWEKWEGKPTAPQKGLLAFFVLLFGLGVSTAWHRSRWLGLLPLGVNLAYDLWTSVALLSGERFMVSMDWSVYLYYMIGIFALLSGFMLVLKGGHSAVRRWYEANRSSMVPPAGPQSWQHYVLAGLLFLGIGASIPLSEIAFRERYPLAADDQIPNEAISAATGEASGPDRACLQKLASNGQARIVQGRALYPRFYGAGEGEAFTDAIGYKIVDASRLVFEMVGQKDGRIIVPMSRAPDFFPNAADVTLLLDREDQVLMALVAKAGTERLYLSDDFNPSDCE